jgi:ubiquinone/menaquinone biosynthesis C-methylase UbiE
MNNTHDLINSYNQIHSTTDKLLEMPSFYTWVLDKMGIPKNARLLDIATGTGMLVKFAEEMGIDAIGLDIAYEALQKGKTCYHFNKPVLGDGQNLPFDDGEFPFVANIGSLEHFPDITRGIHEIVRVMTDDGIAAIFLPNSYYLGDILKTVMLDGNPPNHNQMIDRFATINEWKNLLEKNGLVVKKVHRYNLLFPQTKEDWKYLRDRPRRFLGILISPFIPFNLSYSFLYICRKKQAEDK